MWRVFARYAAVLVAVCALGRRVSARHDATVVLSPEANLPGPALPTPCLARLGESIWAQHAERDWVPRCDRYGDFEPLQCTTGNAESGHKRCFCVDLSGAEVADTPHVSLTSAETELSLHCPHNSDQTRVCGLAVQRDDRFATHHPRPPACLARDSEAHHAWTIVQEQCVGLQDNPEMLLRGAKNLDRNGCRAVLCPASAGGAAFDCIGALEMWKQALQRCNLDSNFMGTLQIAEAWTLACRSEVVAEHHVNTVATVEVGSGVAELPADGNLNGCGVREMVTTLRAIDDSCCSTKVVDFDRASAAHGSNNAVDLCAGGMPSTCGPAVDTGSGSGCAQVVVPFFEMCGNQLDPVAHESIRTLSLLCTPSNGGRVFAGSGGESLERSTMSDNVHAHESSSLRVDLVAQLLGVLVIAAVAAAAIAMARTPQTASADSATVVVNGLYGHQADAESECAKSMRGLPGDSWVDYVVSAYDLGHHNDAGRGDGAGADDNGSQAAQSRR